MHELQDWTAALPYVTPSWNSYVSVDDCEATIAAATDMPDRVPNHWGVYFMVDDVEAMAAKAVELGGQLVAPIMTMPVGQIAMIHDGQNGNFSMIQPPAEG